MKQIQLSIQSYKWILGCFLFSLLIIATLGWCDSSNHPNLDQIALQGSSLGTAEVQQLENKLIKNPEDLSIRAKLLGYYRFKSFEFDESRKKHQEHALWVIEHHPDSELTGLAWTGLDPILDINAYPKGKELWLKHVEKSKNNTSILGNAANYFLIYEKDLAEKFLIEAQKLEPENPKWPQNLAQLYALEGKHPKSKEDQKESYKKSLLQLEKSYQLSKSIQEQSYLLDDLAKYAFGADEFIKAKEYANLLLDLSTTLKNDWNYGNAIHHGNIVLGRIALIDGEISKAKEYLLKSGNTPGSPQLNSFGPNMSLAKDLLENGEKKIVVEYLNLCKKFWSEGDLNDWILQIENNKIPDFGANLVY